jgi:hypothetical protein
LYQYDQILKPSTPKLQLKTMHLGAIQKVRSLILGCGLIFERSKAAQAIPVRCVMCGRYVRRATKKAITDWFGVDPEHLPKFGPSFNIAPQTFQPVVRLSLESGEREIVLMRWAVCPIFCTSSVVSVAQLFFINR